MKKPLAYTLLITLLIPGVVNAAASEAALTVPKFDCDLPTFKPSGDAAYEVRQLERIERRYKACVQTFKDALRAQQTHIQTLRLDSTPDQVKDFDRALRLIEQILAHDFESAPGGPTPDRRNFVDPNHGG